MDTKPKSPSRRAFLTSALGAGVAASVARGQSLEGHGSTLGAIPDEDFDKYDFVFCRVKFAAARGATDYWHVRPGGDANLLQALEQVTALKVKHITGTRHWQPHVARKGQFNAVVTFDEPERLGHFPFLFMTSESHYFFTDSQKANLKEYIERGGFMLMDDCMASRPTDDFFYQSSKSLLEEVFGRSKVRPVPNEHPIFHTVYDLGDIGLPHLNGVEHGAWGLFDGDRLAVLLSSHDIHCGWCDGDNSVHRGGGVHGKHGHKEAIQMGINTILYALSH